MADNNTTSQSQNQQGKNSLMSSYTGTGTTGSSQGQTGTQATSNTMTAQTGVQSSYTGTGTTGSSTQAGTQATGSTVQAQTGVQSAAGGAKTVKTVIGVFESRDNAEKAVNELRQQGFSTEEINILSKKDRHQGRQGETYDDDISDGALTGGTLGGIGGLLLGAGALAIPGVGPVIAVGPIAAALSGAVAGGVAGGLIDWGIPSEASRRYEQEVVQGKILAVIRADAAKVNAAAQILRQNGAKDVESHDLR